MLRLTADGGRWAAVCILTGAASVALVTALAAPASTNATRLVGTTGPGLKITLTKGGRVVDYLKPGKYAITVRDRSARHGFTMTGRTDTGRFVGPVKITSLRFVGTRTISMRLVPGLYYYGCPAHNAPERGGMTGPPFRVQ